MSYSYQAEIDSYRDRARRLRERASSLRARAAADAIELEREAKRTDERAEGILRLCTRGAEARTS